MFPQEGTYFTNYCHWETKHRKVFPKCHTQSEIYDNHIPPKGALSTVQILFESLFSSDGYESICT